MVAQLGLPVRPLQGGTATRWEVHQHRVRLYHHDGHSPSGLHKRSFGPLHRFDHHRPDSDGNATNDPEREVLYLADRLCTCGAEVFGDEREANICPRFRVVAAVPLVPALLQVLFGSAVMQIGATMTLGTGQVDRETSQAWARAIYEDHPTGSPVAGVRYHGAHDNGHAVAVWDRVPDLGVVVQNDGVQADFALRGFAPIWKIFLRQMRERRITVRTIESQDCVSCQRNPPLSVAYSD